MVDRICKNCACFCPCEDWGDGIDGKCLRYPRVIWKSARDTCFEHRYQLPDKDLLDTNIELLKTSPRTRRICKNLRLKTVGDLLAVGRLHIAPAGVVDTQAVRELEYAMDQIGVDW